MPSPCLTPAIVFLAVDCAFCAAADPNPGAATEAELVRRSLVSRGNSARLERVLARARSGGAVTIGVIGGSITAGASASRPENRWGNLVAQWWREHVPDSRVTFVNAGIGATGSNIAAHRVKRDLLASNPDLVVAEFGVNDPNTELAAETLEGMLRQILRTPNHPAVMLLFTMHRNGGNAQEWHGKVGRHYGLPMVSFRDALWPEIEAGRLRWEDVEADEVHPNDRGHRYCATFVTAVIGDVLASLPAEASGRMPPLPAPLISDVFERTALLNAESTTPAGNTGWSPLPKCPFGPGWRSDTPGSVLELDVSGTAVSLVFHRIKRDMGIARASTDGGEPVDMDAWFNADWGGYSAWQLVARGLQPGTHRLRIELLDRKAEQSTGHTFELRAVMCAGR